jgi:hypothetical protein
MGYQSMVFTTHDVIIPVEALSLLLQCLQHALFVLPVTNPAATIAPEQVSGSLN